MFDPTIATAATGLDLHLWLRPRANWAKPRTRQALAGLVIMLVIRAATRNILGHDQEMRAVW
jgi:hypothetical protein